MGVRGKEQCSVSWDFILDQTPLLGPSFDLRTATCCMEKNKCDISYYGLASAVRRQERRVALRTVHITARASTEVGIFHVFYPSMQHLVLTALPDISGAI